MVDISTVFLYALITALATGLGAIPFLFSKNISPMWEGRGQALAAGLMVAASVGLFIEGIAVESGVILTMLGLIVGLLLVHIVHEKLESRDDLSIKNLPKAQALQAILIVGVMTLHSVAEGVGIGVAFCCDPQFGATISAALAIHNIPEGLAISLILIPMGISVRKAAFWSIFSSLPQPLIAIPAFLFAQSFLPFLPFGLGLAAGAMLWMSFSELIPEAYEKVDHDQVGIILTIACALMLVFQFSL